MDVQSAANLNIPEGSVRNIHDKDKRLLWSAVGYNVRYDGDTTQQTYTGKNLLKLHSTSDTFNDITFTRNSDGSFDISGTATANTEFKSDVIPLAESGIIGGQSYTISSTATIGSNKIYYYVHSCTSNGGWDKTLLSFSSASTKVAEEPSTQYVYFVVRVNNGKTVDFTNVKTQIEKSTTATSFEPYVGGIPSPNPDYPQDINVVKGTQTVNVMGKNLCYDIQRPTTNSIRFFFSKALSSSTITISTALNVATASNTISLWVDNSNIGNIGTFSGNAGETISRTFTFTESQMSAIQSGSEIYLQLYKSNAGFTLPTWAQIELGSTATAYEPYQSQSYTVNLGSIELCKLGNYQDYIYKGADGWYVHKDMDKVILDGTGTWNSYTYHPAEYTYMHNVDGARSGYRTSICSHFTNVDGAWQEGVGQPGYYSDHPTLGRKYFVSDKTTVSDFTTWLSNHNVLLRYALETPTDTKITDSTLVAQLNAIHDWLTRYDYYPIVTGDLPIVINRVLLT